MKNATIYVKSVHIWFIKDYSFNGITSKKAETDTENIPAIKYEKDIKDKDRLEKIVCGLQTDWCCRRGTWMAGYKTNC